MNFWNDGTFTKTSSVQGLPIILKWHNLQSLIKALDLFIEFKFCESDFYFLNGNKNCMVATYNFGSVYILEHNLKSEKKYLLFNYSWNFLSSLRIENKWLVSTENRFVFNEKGEKQW